MKSYKLFLIIPPGLEDLARKEIEIKMPLTELTMIKGGIELTTDLDWIVRAHLLLKIPTRILLRITEFKVRDFPRLYKKFSDFNWQPYLSHPEPTWEISCSKSRLNHTGRMEETIKKALNEYLIKQPLNQDWKKKSYPAQTFFIRLVDDLLTLSLDLTGEPLYKRGLQKIKGEAPLRENLAAAFILELFDGVSDPITLADPMCGSATLLTEALHFFSPLHLRPFAFETAPFFKGQLVKKIKVDSELPIEAALGFDINAELLQKVRQQLPHPKLTLTEIDSLKEPLPVSPPLLMICNPPYGERIKVEGKRGHFLKAAWKKFLTQDQPDRFGWLLPSDMDTLFPTPNGYQLKVKRHLKNGGLAVTFWIWHKIQSK